MAPETEEEPTRRQFVKGLGVLAALGLAGAGAAVAVRRPDLPGGVSVDQVGGAGSPLVDRLAANVVAGGPGKDGIPSIDEPRFVAADDAGFLSDGDPVFGLVHRGQVRCYPQLVLVFHEIVNDIVGGEPLSVTYCPLTGSVVAFRGGDDRLPLTFGTTGNLVNSNLLMYDVVTDSEWPQLLGIAIRGRLRGHRLEEIPLVWAPWGRWRAAHPDTVVLSTDTGHLRSYGSDPYGSYAPLGGYYAGAVGRRDAGAGGLGRRTATARVFLRWLAGRTLRFEPGSRRDQFGTDWSAGGEAVSGPLEGQQLPTAHFMDVMWFAWHAFYPVTAVVR